MIFESEEIIRRLGLPPKELRRIASKLEREKTKTMSEAERIQEEYYQKFIQNIGKKCLN